MEPFTLSLIFTLKLVFKMGAIMFVSLFGIELLLQMGLMTYFKPVGKPVAGLAKLPAESALTFLTAIGSMIAAHAMAAQFYADRKLSFHQLAATGVLNTVPFHFKETLTFQIPVVLPLLGPELCLIYVGAFWLTGVIKLIFVVVYGRFFITEPAAERDPFGSSQCDPGDPACTRRSFKQLLADTWTARNRMFFKMILLLAIVTFIIQLLVHTGLMTGFERMIRPMTDWFNLPAAVVGPVTTYIFSPTVGITYMSNIMNQNLVSPFQAIVALMAGSILMIPVTRLRRTLPRYISIYGMKNGLVVGGLTTGLSLVSRIITLAGILIFYS